MAYWKCKECGALLLDNVSAQGHAIIEGLPFDKIMKKVVNHD